jgi:hypothetical protein
MLAPIRVVQTFVSHGHDLEIPTTLWKRGSRLGHELELDSLDPDGRVARTLSEPHQQDIGHRSARRMAAPAFPAARREDDSSCAECVDLTGAF